MQISGKLRNWRDEATGREGLSYWCHGCRSMHSVTTKGGKQGASWTWNGDLEKPTFHPSVVTKSGHYCDGQPQPPNCGFCRDAAEHGGPSWCQLCHTWVKHGTVQFLDDCSHDLRGVHQLPELPEHCRD